MKSRILIIANQGDPTFNIVQIIEQSLSEIVTIENAVSIWDAKIKIREFDPDVLIVDIDIEEEVITLEFLQNILYKKFKIIIIAGQPDHAIDAFKIQALDFLLKPVNPLSLTSAIQRAIEHKLIKSRLTEFQHPFIGSSHSLRVLPNKISLYSEGKMILLSRLIYYISKLKEAIPMPYYEMEKSFSYQETSVFSNHVSTTRNLSERTVLTSSI
ncbi:MAG: response regulator [Saprospiraceae bacterium]|nr:response regulator [Candidatus Vicinibacter affinis]